MKEYAIISPQAGIKTDAPRVLLKDAFSPLSMNTWVHNERIDRATMRLREFSAQLPDDPLGISFYERKSLTNYLMVMTKRDICRRDDTNDRFVFLTPQYTTGVIMVTNGSLKIQGGLLIDDCDDNPVDWADRSGGDVTPSRETTIVQENAVSVKLAVVDGAGVEDLASNNNVAGIDLSAYDSVGFWFRSSVVLAAGDLKFELNDAVDLGGVAQETIDIPVIPANTWTWVNLTLVDPSNCAAIKSWGIIQAVDKGAMDLYIDFIVAGDWAGQLNQYDFIKIGSAVASTDDTWYEIVSATDTEITLTAVYAGTTAYQQTYIARQTFTGDDDDLWSFCTAYYDDKWIATNNSVDYSIYWDGSTTTVLVLTTLFKASYVTYFEGFVVFGKLANFPQRIKWSDLNDYANYSTGDAGTADIEGADPLSGFSKWQDFMVVFKERSIHLMWLVETDDIFNRDMRVVNIGCYAAHSIIAHQNKVYFWSSDNKFRAFNGLHANEEISMNIDDIASNVASNYEVNIYGTYIEELKQLWWAIPKDSSSLYNDLVLTYDLQTKSWGKLDLAVTCFGTYITETGMTWDTLPWATWDEWAGRWDDRTFTANAPLDLMGHRDNYIYRVHASELDNAVDFTGSFELNQNFFGEINLRKRLLRYRIFFEREVGETIDLAIRMDDEFVKESEVTRNLDDQPLRDVQEIEVVCDYNGKSFGIYAEADGPFKFLGIIYEYITIGDR